MTNTRANSAPILTPAQVHELLVKPVVGLTPAGNPAVATVVPIDSGTFRMPAITEDASAAFVAEGAEIPVSDVTFGEQEVVPRKVAGLVVISSELAEDSSPEAAAIVGDSLARDIARRVTQAFFGNMPLPAPAGLASLAVGGANGVVDLPIGTAPTNFDGFEAAVAAAEGVDAALTAYVTNPATALVLAGVKESSGSGKPLLGSDPSKPTQRVIGGLPLLRSTSVPAGTVWGLSASRVYVVVRRDAEVRSDASAFFTSDRVAVRATMRVGFGWADPRALVRIRLAAS